MAKTRCRVETSPKRVQLRPNRATRLVEIGLHLPLATFSDGIPCKGHSARKSTLFGHRCTLFWPPPVRLFAQPTHAREASPQHPAGDVDAYAHTHAHADQLWGPQYENAVPVPRVMWQGRTDLTEVSGTTVMNVVHNSQKFFVRVLMLCRTHISSGYR